MYHRRRWQNRIRRGRAPGNAGIKKFCGVLIGRELRLAGLGVREDAEGGPCFRPQVMPMLSSERAFRSLVLSGSVFPILPTAPAPDPCLWHAELSPGKLLTPRLHRHSSSCG